MNRSFILAACVAAMFATSACQYLEKMTQTDYDAVSDRPPLDVPPDLSDLPPSGTDQTSATYSAYTAGEKQRETQRTAVLPQYADIKLVREAQSRHLVVAADPAQVWEKLRTFFPKNKLEVEREEATLGLIETSWNDNQVIVRKTVGNFANWFASVRGSSKRDKFRLRVERGVTPGTSEIYLTHSGMLEIVYHPDDTTRDVGNAGWERRPTEPELEAEMLQRLVIHLGGEPENAKAIAASATQPVAPSSRITRNGDGAPTLVLSDDFDRAWRRVGMSLDRIGFTVEDRDRSRGVYYIRYVDPDKPVKKRWFSSDEPPAPEQYQIHLAQQAAATQIIIRNKSGNTEHSKVSERILTLLEEHVK